MCCNYLILLLLRFFVSLFQNMLSTYAGLSGYSFLEVISDNLLILLFIFALRISHFCLLLLRPTTSVCILHFPHISINTRPNLQICVQFPLFVFRVLWHLRCFHFCSSVAHLYSLVRLCIHPTLYLDLFSIRFEFQIFSLFC